MIVAMDVQYRDPDASVACVYFRDWADGTAEAQVVCPVKGVLPYEPGSFYKRELPCLLAGLKAGARDVDLIVIDGYVWLDGAGRPGLGARLYDGLGARTPVIGVSKTAFHADDFSVQVMRGASKTPLYVTAVGIAQEDAAKHIQAMHGANRIPTLLKLADRLAREG